MNLKFNKFNFGLYKMRMMKWDVLCKCAIAALLLFAVGCTSTKQINPDILYFQKDLDTMVTVQVSESIIKTNDVLNVQVFSKSLIQDQAAIFNLPDKNVAVGLDGTIEMPILGKIRAAGLTKVQLQHALEDKLTNYIKNPAVLVKLAQFNVNVLGEVKSPGTHAFTAERVTIIDAISAAGDLTDAGKREDITVIREVDTVRTLYHVDLRSGTLFLSPAFQMQPNDIVYVGAYMKKLRALNTAPERVNGLQTTALVLSILTSATFLYYFYKNNNN